MKRLYLIRHSKADHTKNCEDRERPLSHAGITRCAQVAAAMVERGYQPEYFLTSPARRAEDTAQRIARALPKKTAVKENPKLYLATPGEILAQLGHMPETVQALALVGHNPGLQQLAVLLTHRASPKLLQAVTVDFPPGAVVVYDLEITHWQQVEAGVGVLVDYLNPGCAF